MVEDEDRGRGVEEETTDKRLQDSEYMEPWRVNGILRMKGAYSRIIGGLRPQLNLRLSLTLPLRPSSRSKAWFE